MTLALAVVLVLGATTLAATAQQPTPPAAEIDTLADDQLERLFQSQPRPRPASKIDKGDTA
jgi:hypothetical protein